MRTPDSFSIATDEELFETVKGIVIGHAYNEASESLACAALEEMLERLQRRADANRRFYNADGSFDIADPADVVQRRKQAAVDAQRMKDWIAQARPWVQDRGSKLRNAMDDLVPPRRRPEEPKPLQHAKHFKCAWCRSDWTLYNAPTPKNCPTCGADAVSEVA